MISGNTLLKKSISMVILMSNIIDSNSLVPVILKSQFDAVATEFLMEFYPEALERPMAVPILYIAKKKLGLKVCTKYSLSEDLSILGQMCFTSGVVDLYVKETDEFIEKTVRRGTMFIDADVITERNEGCYNNTIAHECVHWYKHRNYHLLKQITEDRSSKKKRCPATGLDEFPKDRWTDEDWMEWQANGIAPRILMPKNMFIRQASIFCEQWQAGNRTTPLNYYWLKNQLAAFFDVSKQSAGIRMDELGILQ